MNNGPLPPSLHHVSPYASIFATSAFEPNQRWQSEKKLREIISTYFNRHQTDICFSTIPSRADKFFCQTHSITCMISTFALHFTLLRNLQPKYFCASFSLHDDSHWPTYLNKWCLLSDTPCETVVCMPSTPLLCFAPARVKVKHYDYDPIGTWGIMKT